MPSTLTDGCSVVAVSENSTAIAVSVDNKATAIATIATLDPGSENDTAQASDVIYGKTFHARGVSLTGSMPDRTGAGGTITTVAGVYTIQNGYHDGTGTVAIDSADQALLIAENIKSGVTILGVTGTHSGGGTVTAQEKTVTPSENQQVITPDTGYDYLSKVTVNAIEVMTSQEITAAVSAGWNGGS